MPPKSLPNFWGAYQICAAAFLSVQRLEHKYHRFVFDRLL